jgi:hypothetical protein
VGFCTGCPEGGGGGGGGKGVSGTQHPATCFLGRGYKVPPWSDLMIRVARPWNLLLLLLGPGPSSLLHSTRSNTIVIRMWHIPPIGLPLCCSCEPGVLLLNSSAEASSSQLLLATAATPLDPCFFLCACSLLHGWRPSDGDARPHQGCLQAGWH